MISKRRANFLEQQIIVEEGVHVLGWGPIDSKEARALITS